MMCLRPATLKELMKECPICGIFNPRRSTKCEKCGADFSETAVKEQEQEVSKEEDS